MKKIILVTAAILGVLSVLLGAFGAHGLKALISFESLQTYEIGIRYQMYHALLLLFVGNTALVSAKSKKTIYYLVLIGLVLFSCSLYGLATNTLTAFDFNSIGILTPIGGLLLIGSWSLLLINFLKIKTDK